MSRPSIGDPPIDLLEGRIELKLETVDRSFEAVDCRLAALQASINATSPDPTQVALVVARLRATNR